MTLTPLERLFLVIARKPDWEGKSYVRMCIYCIFSCLYVLTDYYYTCHCMHCMRDPFCFLRYPYGPSGILLVWIILFVHSQVYYKDEIRYKVVVEVHG